MDIKKIVYALFLILVAGASALAGATAGGLAVYNAIKRNSAMAAQAAPTPQISTTQVPANTILQTNTIEVQSAITQVVQKVGPTVVTVVGTTPDQPGFFGTISGGTVSGSGVIVSADGTILTNNHVIANTTQVSIVFADGKQVPATIVGKHQYSDLAVLKVNAKVPSVAVLGNSDALQPGETVIAMGSPLGDFKNTVTVGVVSATGRSLDTGNGYQLQNLIQTDAAINNGNSGGPLLNLAGQVIGLNTLILRSSGSGSIVEGFGFAIPANMVKAVADQIVKQGYVARPALGIRWQAVTPDLAQQFNLPAQWGVYVAGVRQGSPVEAAGVQVGDIITKINDIAIDNTHPYINVLFEFKPDQVVKLTIVRGQETLQIDVKLVADTSN